MGGERAYMRNEYNRNFSRRYIHSLGRKVMKKKKKRISVEQMEIESIVFASVSRGFQ